MTDAHKNFAYSTVATAPSPATSGTSLVVAAGQGALFPAVPFNATIWPVSSQPTAANAEIVRVTARSTDTLTITRAQESTSARTVVVGDQIAATITAKTLTDIEALTWDVISRKTADETLSASTTIQDDDHLALPISASSTEAWFFELFMPVGAPNTTMDFKIGWSFPSGCTIRWGQYAAGSGAYGPYTPTGTPVAPNDESTVLGFDLASATYNPIHAVGWVFGGGTAGNVVPKWAQRTSDAGTLTVKKGAVLRAMKIAS